jgi:hypothetical protein
MAMTTTATPLTVETIQTKLVHWSTTILTIFRRTQREAEKKDSTDAYRVITKVQT